MIVSTRKWERAIYPAVLFVDMRHALRNILRQRHRSLIAILAIGFGVVSMLLASGYIEWLLWATREGTIKNQYGHFQVVRPGYFEGGKSEPFAYLLPDESPALRILEHTPNVASISTRMNFSGLVSHGDTTVSFIGEGVDPEKDPSTKFVYITNGERLSSRVPNGVLMGAGLAANLGVKTGDAITLLVNTPSGGINAVEGKVIGLASVFQKAFDDAVLRIPIGMAHKLLRVSGAHSWIVMLNETEQTDAVMAKLRAQQAFRKFEIVPWYKLADFYNKTVELFARQIGVVKLIIASIIVLSISNTMTMSVMERTVEIGTAMALGVRRNRILRLFLLEGVLLGAVGGVCGALIGYSASLVISAIGIPMPAAPGMSRGYTAAIMVTPAIIWEALLLAIVTTLLASLYPAWRASRLVIVDALRHNR